MKYLIGNRVINADQINQVQYMPANETTHGDSACFIDFKANGSEDWDIILRGIQADAFWDVYSKDAYAVVV